jgi:alkylation response protein AidB-like acyl-CoA dehydrogenase
MDFQLSEDQEALVSALQAILQDYDEVPAAERYGYCYYNADLQRTLSENGFLGAAREMGPVEAALVVIETARLPVMSETSATGLVAPMVLPDLTLKGPVAVATAESVASGQPVRNLAIARSLIVDLGADVAVIDIDPADVEPVTTILAYPYGRLRQPADLTAAKRVAGVGPRLRTWLRTAIAAEAAGAIDAAIAFTVDYVKERHVFGRPVGSFQSVQHRLVQDYGVAKSAYYLALRAAWSGDPEQAAAAACFVQQAVPKLLFDLHQFHGGMGVTTEHLLHFWTMRLRALQGEAGGAHGAALAIADCRWPQIEGERT